MKPSQRFAKHVARVGLGLRTSIDQMLLARWSPYLVLAACAVAPVIWLRGGYPVKTVDSFMSVHPAGLTWYNLFAWEARDSTGVPTSDVVTWDVTGLQIALAHLGLPLVTSEALILTALAGCAATGMFHLSSLLLGAYIGGPPRRWICAVVSATWLANPFALSFVWYHQLLTEVTWAALPWVVYIALRVVGADTVALGRPLDRRRYWLLPWIPVIMILGSAGFVHAYLPALGLLFVGLGAGVLSASHRKLIALRDLVLVAGVLAASLAWWLLPSLPLLPALLNSASIGPASETQFLFASQFSRLPEVVTLTAVQALHQTVDGVPYMSWSNLVLGAPGVALRFMLPATAALGAIAAYRAPSVRWFAISGACVCCGAVLLSKGFNWPLPALNLALTNVPLGDAFRHPLDKFATLLVLPLCLLFGFGLAFLWRSSKLTAAIAGVVVAGYLAMPWWTGAVIPVGGGILPSAYIQMPPSYDLVGSVLASSPAGGKTMVLPFSLNGESAFNWPLGVQPNLDCLLQDWSPARSTLCHSTGQSLADTIPLAIAKGLSRGDYRTFELARLAGIDRWVVHKDWDSAYLRADPSPETGLALLGNPNGLIPAPKLPRNGQRFGMPRKGEPISFFFRSNSPPHIDDKLISLGPLTIQVNRVPGAPHLVYVGMYDISSGAWETSAPLSMGVWHQVAVIESGSEFSLSTDGIVSQQAFTCFPCVPSARTAIVVAPRPSVIDILRAQEPGLTEMTSLVSDLTGFEHYDVGSQIQLKLSTPQLALYAQPALPLIYVAHSVAKYDSDLLGSASTVARLSSPVLLPATPSFSSLDASAKTTWREDSPTMFHGRLNINGFAVIVFLQTFDPHWRLILDAASATLRSHQVANGFGNAWTVHGYGWVNWTLAYDLEPAVLVGGFGGGCLIAAAVAVIAWRSAVRCSGRRRRRTMRT